MSEEMKTKAEIREAIQAVDADLVDILARRAELAEAMARAKAADGSPVRDREREEAVMRRAAERGAEKGLPTEFIERLYQDLFRVSVERQRTRFDGVGEGELNEAVVAYLGGPGSYSHLAAQAFFNHRSQTVSPAPKRDYVSIFRAVESGEVQFGLLPIENTTTGGVSEVYDLLIGGKVKIVGEQHLRIDHCLVGKTGGQGRTKRVYGHPQMLAECRKFFIGHPEIATHYVSSTTRSLERLLEEDEEAAAVAGPDAARLFGYDIYARGISDHEQNHTRFIVIAADSRRPAKAVDCKVSLTFVTADKPGALLDALTGFRDSGINIVKLESRPIPGNPWEEMFIMDMDGHLEDAAMAKAMDALQLHTREMRMLGCYAADRVDPVTLKSGGAEG